MSMLIGADATRVFESERVRLFSTGDDRSGEGEARYTARQSAGLAAIAAAQAEVMVPVQLGSRERDTYVPTETGVAPAGSGAGGPNEGIQPGSEEGLPALTEA